ASDDAVRLLVERAEAAAPEFHLDAAGAEPAARLCRALDGQPLAIELAAARLRSLTLQQVADRLDDRFALLKTGTRVPPPRHQTLRAVVDWSWDLLGEDERRLLRRLGVFAGAPSLATVEAVCGGEDVVDVLAALVDRSLVVAEQSGGETRYRLLETVRAYA